MLGLAFKLYDPDHLIGTDEDIGITRRARADQPAGRRDRPPASAGVAGLPERSELRPRRLHPDRPHHRRRRAGRQRLEDADERARRRPRHLAAVARRRRPAPSPRIPPACMRACASSSMSRSAGSKRSRSGSAAWRRPPIWSMRARRFTCAGHRPRPQARGRHRDHEVAGDRAHARVASTTPWTCMAARACRTGRRTISAALPRGPDRHHGRRRQHRHPRADPVRPGRDPLPSLSAQGDGGARGQGPRARPRRVRQGVLGRMSATASRTRSAPGARAGPAACSRPRRMPARRGRFYRPLGRYASAFALAVDMALLTLGGGLKRREMISARFGDILSELFLLSAVLKRWEDEGRQAGRPAAGALVHGGGPRHHRDAASTRSSPTSRTGRWRGCCASWCCRSGRAAAARRIA